MERGRMLAAFARDGAQHFGLQMPLSTFLHPFVTYIDINFASITVYAGQEEGLGNIGHSGPLLRRLNKQTRLIRVDVATEEPIRDPKTGLCIESALGEPGEAIGLINEGADNTMKAQTFKGYLGDEKETNKKILRDVFVKGDKYFRMGDLLRMDPDGYLYFMDRLGDTFRWRGENVSTVEVGNVLMQHPDVSEANVYGVKVPGWDDGRAGMAAITLRPESRGAREPQIMADLGKFTAARLPKYAIPIFIRLQPEQEITGTFKHRKVDLQKESCDVNVIQDPMYWFDSARGYVPFGKKEYNDIVAGKVKL